MPTSAEPVAYLDSSALVKLVVREDESEALMDHLRERRDHASCALARVEVVRAVQAHGRPAVSRAQRLLERIALIRLDDVLLDEAAALGDRVLRSLDAIHLAAARALGETAVEVITYDHRLAAAAHELGLPVSAPA